MKRASEAYERSRAREQRLRDPKVREELHERGLLGFTSDELRGLPESDLEGFDQSLLDPPDG